MTAENNDEARKEIAKNLLKNGFRISRDQLELYEYILKKPKSTRHLNIEIVEDIEENPMIRIRINFPSVLELNSYQARVVAEFNRRKRQETKKGKNST